MSLTKRWVVYQHVNLVNGKRYIGITCQKLNQRWHNGEGYRESSRFYSAIKHYGWDGFRHEVLFEGLTRERAEALEIELIAKYDTMNPDKGYNLTTGGSTPTVTEETRRKHREAKLGHTLSAESRAKMSAHLKGRKMSAESRRKMSISRSGANNHNARAILCVETGEVWPTLAAAAAATGALSANICRCCQGKRNIAGGYHWEYVDTPIFDTQNS